MKTKWIEILYGFRVCFLCCWVRGDCSIFQDIFWFQFFLYFWPFKVLLPFSCWLLSILVHICCYLLVWLWWQWVVFLLWFFLFLLAHWVWMWRYSIATAPFWTHTWRIRNPWVLQWVPYYSWDRWLWYHYLVTILSCSNR